jgi:hypothetical protein
MLPHPEENGVRKTKHGAIILFGHVEVTVQAASERNTPLMNHIIHNLKVKSLYLAEIQYAKDHDDAPSAAAQKGIARHKEAAIHFEAAAHSHLDAAMHHGVGEHEKAALCTIEAHGHAVHANEEQAEILQHTTSNE